MKRDKTLLSILWMPFSAILRRLVQAFVQVPAEEDLDHLTITISTR
jgi:hypothetical protein